MNTTPRLFVTFPPGHTGLKAAANGELTAETRRHGNASPSNDSFSPDLLFASSALSPRLRVSAVGSVLVALLLTSACSRTAPPDVVSPAPVQVTAVTQDTIRRVVAGDGVLFPLDQYTA